MLFWKVIAREFTQTEQTGVLRDSFKSHADAELLKEFVVGVRERLGEIHVLVAAANLEHRVARNYVFLEGSDRDGRLDGRARDVAGAKGNLLIYDGQDAAAVGIDGDNGAIVAAEAFHSGGAN